MILDAILFNPYVTEGRTDGPTDSTSFRDTRTRPEILLMRGKRTKCGLKEKKGKKGRWMMRESRRKADKRQSFSSKPTTSNVLVRGCSKKVYNDLNHVEKCGFLHGVQHVLKNISEVFLDIAKFWPSLLYFMGIFGKKKFEVVENEIEWILPERTGI